VIGDSFVYGMSATPFFNSFTDILLARGYMIYAAGIPGTDPSQYAAIAQKYIPIVKPDLVIVCFFEGNDYMLFPREPKQNQPHEHMTNAGFYSSNPLGRYMDAIEAYSYYSSLITIPKNEPNRLNQFCSRTVLGSQLWGVANACHFVPHNAVAFYDSVTFSSPWSYAYTASRLNIIDSVGAHNKVKTIHVVIPDVFGKHNSRKEFVTIDTASVKKVQLLRSYYAPNNLSSVTDFPKGDCHFNNSGSLKFANFLDTILQQNITLH
jgi:hypothetical protein